MKRMMELAQSRGGENITVNFRESGAVASHGETSFGKEDVVNNRSGLQSAAAIK